MLVNIGAAPAVIAPKPSAFQISSLASVWSVLAKSLLSITTYISVSPLEGTLIPVAEPPLGSASKTISKILPLAFTWVYAVLLVKVPLTTSSWSPEGFEYLVTSTKSTILKSNFGWIPAADVTPEILLLLELL